MSEVGKAHEGNMGQNTRGVRTKDTVRDLESSFPMPWVPDKYTRSTDKTSSIISGQEPRDHTLPCRLVRHPGQVGKTGRKP